MQVIRIILMVGIFRTWIWDGDGHGCRGGRYLANENSSITYSIQGTIVTSNREGKLAGSTTRGSWGE